MSEQRLIKFEDERKAIFELCYQDHLEILFHQLTEGEALCPTFKTLDEEFLACQQNRP